MHKRRRVAAFLGPAPADFALLADPAFILHPAFDVLRLGVVALDLCQNLRELRFECRLSDRVCLMVPRSADQWHKVHRMQPCARGFRTYTNTPLVLHQIHNVTNLVFGTAIIPVLRPRQNHPFQLSALLAGQFGRTPRARPVFQPGNPIGIVMLHRPGQSLRIQTNQRSRFAPPSSVQDERDAKEALNHLPILCRLRRQTQFLWSLVLSHRHHRKPPVIHSGRAGRHPLQGIPMIMLFRESYKSIRSAVHDEIETLENEMASALKSADSDYAALNTLIPLRVDAARRDEEYNKQNSNSLTYSNYY